MKRYLMVGDKELAFQNDEPASKGGFQGPSLTRPRIMNHLAPSPTQRLEGTSDFKSLRSLLQSVKSETEKNVITAALEKTGWNRKAAARMLEVSYRSLLYKIEEYHLVSSDSVFLPPGKRTKSATSDSMTTAVENV